MYIVQFCKVVARPPADRLTSYRGQTGFSLVELMIAVAVLGILLGIAVPNFNEWINSTRVGMQADDFVSDLSLARSEAATRGLRTVVCVSTNGTSCVTAATSWENGRLMFVDSNADGLVSTGERILKYEQAAKGNTTIASTYTISLTYAPYGGLVPVTSGTFTFCSASSRAGRQVAVAATGRVNNTRTVCP